VEISARRHFAARVGPTSTYIAYGQGCAGSRPATRLVPRDTPHVGKTLEVRLFDLPEHAAFITFGWNRHPTPISLQPLGMPGCQQYATIDAHAFLMGNHHTALYRLPIPNLPGLVGLRFHNQALVLDRAANNALGAVVSDAAEAVVGGG
jgi:hypothetical protein